MPATPRARSVAFLALLFLAVFAAFAQPEARPLTERPYSGLRLRDTPEGPVAAGVSPGPLGGNGYRSPTIWRGDFIDAVNGQRRSAAEFAALIASMSPGDELTIAYRRAAGADPEAAVPKGDPAGELRTVVVALEAADVWTGTIGRPVRTDAQPIPPSPGEFEETILQRAGALGLMEGPDAVVAESDAEAAKKTHFGGLSKLLTRLRAVQSSTPDENAVPAVINMFERPLALDAEEARLALAVRAGISKPSEAVRLAAQVLDSARLGPTENAEQLIRGLRLSELFEPAKDLVRTGRDSVSVDPAKAREQIALIRRSADALHRLLPWYERIAPVMEEWEGVGRVNESHGPVAVTDETVKKAVTGDVLYVMRFQNGGIGVVGGKGPNTYDMRFLADVYDAGGDDVYSFGAADAGNPTRGNHHIIDLGGNDRYTSADEFAGPGVALFGISVVDDRDGNDTYATTSMFSCAAGLFGIGMILDHAGDDTYSTTGPGAAWSLGCGYYGSGMIIDRGGKDSYTGEKLCEGVAGPRGFGAIIDSSGDDTYKANGPNFPSVYGTPGVFAGFSQGFATGVRGYAAGGVGALYDLGGSDTYDCGEFGQGCGYYFALGVLHDAEGDDVYTGPRYNQGSAAHQAGGILIDDAGNDRYTCTGPAGQAGVWDESVAFLIDREGNDSYSAGGLGQGSAAMQALGVLVDLKGDDTYAGGSPLQGEGGTNEYHFNADKLFSFSALLDFGGGKDAYSTGRKNGESVRTGKINAEDLQRSSVNGMCVDE